MIHQQNTTYKPIIREVFAIYPGNDHVHISKRSYSYPKYVFELSQLIYYLICIFSCFHEIALYKTVKSMQFCQLSRIIRETPDFEPYLPVSRLESEISRIITKVCHLISCGPDNEISNILRCLSYFINIERFLTNSGMPLNYKE